MPPTVPREVNCRAIASTSVECFWFPSRDNEGVTYRIYRAFIINWSGNVTCQNLAGVTNSSCELITTPGFPDLVGTSNVDGLERRGFLNTGLDPSTHYKYWVSAVDPSGNESALVGSVHARPTTSDSGTTIDTQITFSASVAPSGSITVTQTITCNPTCSVGHNDLHWGTSMSSMLPNFINFSPGQPAATVHTRTITFSAPSTPRNVYFMEDGHLSGTGYPVDGFGNPPHKEGMLFRVVVTNGSPLTIMPATLPNRTPGVAYSQTLTASGEGVAPFSWGVREARLPPGLAISTGGVISGTPTTPGVYTFSVMVEDSQGTSAFREYAMTVGYYIDQSHPSANNANPGTETLPWATLYEINNRTFVPGDFVFVKNGTYGVTTGGGAYAPAISPRQPGTAGNPITVRNHPGHTPVIDGQNVIDRFKIGCVEDYCVIRGFRLINIADHGMICGTGVPSSTSRRYLGCILERNEVSGITRGQEHNPTCLKLNSTTGGILRDNWCDNDGFTTEANNLGIAGILLEYSDDGIIEHNEVSNIGWGVSDKYSGRGNTVRYNYFRKVLQCGACAQTFGTLQPENDHWHNNIVAFTKREGLHLVGILTSSRGPGGVVEQNTLIVGDAIIGETGLDAGTEPIEPAIFRGNYVQVAASGQNNIRFGTLAVSETNYNAYHTTSQRWFQQGVGTYTPFSAWQATGRDANGIMVSDPMFAGTLDPESRDPTIYRPASGSPLRGAGPGGVHIGAYDTDSRVIGIRSEEAPPPDATPPNAPTNLRVTSLTGLRRTGSILPEEGANAAEDRALSMRMPDGRETKAPLPVWLMALIQMLGPLEVEELAKRVKTLSGAAVLLYIPNGAVVETGK